VGKGGRCVGLTTLPTSCALKSGSLNLLEPSGPVQACNGLIHLYLYLINKRESSVMCLARTWCIDRTVAQGDEGVTVLRNVG
jgi:hypothetical protein